MTPSRTFTGEAEPNGPGAGAAAPIWRRLRFEAGQAAEREPTLASYLNATVLNHDRFSAALCYQLAQKAGGPDMSALQVREICEQAYASDPSIVAAAERDMQAVLDRDPATRSTLQPFLFFKGFLALQTHRVGHWLWGQGRETLAFFLQSRTSELYAVDIHPAAPFGFHRPCDGHCHLRDGEGRRRCFDAAWSDFGRDGKSLHGSSSQDRTRRSPWRGGQSPRRHYGRGGGEGRFRIRRPNGCSAPLFRRRRPCAPCGRGLR